MARDPMGLRLGGEPRAWAWPIHYWNGLKKPKQFLYCFLSALMAGPVPAPLAVVAYLWCQGLGTKASFQPAVRAHPHPSTSGLDTNVQNVWKTILASELWLPAPQAPKLIYLCSCRQNTAIGTQRCSLLSSVDTYAHIPLPNAHSLIIDAVS